MGLLTNLFNKWRTKMAEEQDDEAGEVKPVKKSKFGKTPAKPAKASKKAKDEDEGKEKARKYPETLKVKVLNKENPHREGSSRANAFAALLKCRTMGDYYETGHKIKYIQKWVDDNLIEVG